MTLSTLLPEDLHRVLAHMPKDLRELLHQKDVFLAGGCIRAILAGEPISDWDLFGPHAAVLKIRAKELAEQRDGRFIATKNAFTVLAPPRTPVQFIYRWTFDGPEGLIASFDFSVARAVIYRRHEGGVPKEWVGLCDPMFYPDLASRRLRYMAPERNEDAGGSMLRVQKFIRRGYNISPESLGRVMARVMGGVHTSALTGDEAGKAKVITGLLREVDPLTIIDGVELPPDEIVGEGDEPAGVAA